MAESPQAYASAIGVSYFAQTELHARALYAIVTCLVVTARDRSPQRDSPTESGSTNRLNAPATLRLSSSGCTIAIYPR